MLLLNGDCLEEMQKLIDEGAQVDSVVTDPPYELGFMGKSWDSTGIAFQKETWELAYQLLKPGGHLLAFSSSRTYHRMAVAIEDAGFDIRDQVMWLYGSGFPKSHNIGKAVDAIEKTGKSNPKALREARMGDDYEPTGQKDYVKGRMFSSDIENDDHEHEVNNDWEGWGTALKPAHEPIVLARKPLSEKSVADNVLKHETGGINIDACRIELSEGDDPRLGGEGSWKTDKMAKDVYVGGYAGKDTKSNELGRFPANVMHDGLQEEWSRYFYCPKTSKAERGELNTHPTVKPQKLMQYLCRLVTPKNGTVLDLFMGSGSTGIAAKDEGFNFIGIEKDKEYFEIAEARIKSSSPLMDCFE